MTVDACIAAAEHAFDCGDLRASLVQLLAAWRGVPDPELAGAIDVVGALAAKDLPAPGGNTREDRVAAWRELAAPNDPVARHVLVATLHELDDARTEIECLSMISGQPDPRLTAAIAAVVLRFRPHGPATDWRRLCKLALASGDPRMAAHGDAFLARRQAAVTGGDRRAGAARKRMRVFVDKLRETFAGPPPALSEELRAGIANLASRALGNASTDAAAAGPIEAGLLAAVHAAPADDGPRAIFADWLLERGDPRGELVMLQLAAGDALDRALPERERSLVSLYGERWLGPLAPFIEWAKFVRGFVAECTVRSVDHRFVDLPPDPAWATVVAITGNVPACAMPALRSAKLLDARGMLALAAAEPPLETLEYQCEDDWDPASGPRPDVSLAIAAFATIRLPALRRLSLDGGDTWAAMRPDQLGWAWARLPIRELAVRADVAQLPAWLAEIAGSDLERFELRASRYGDWHAEVMRDTGGRLARLHLVRGYPYRASLDDELAVVAPIVERLAGRISELTIYGISGKYWRLSSRRRIAEMLDRLGPVTAAVGGYEPPKR